jgi:hypothetical protein
LVAAAFLGHIDFEIIQSILSDLISNPVHQIVNEENLH